MHSKEAAGCRLCRYRRVQEKRQDRDCLNGEVTVYLTLTFVLFVSLILALVESASVQMAKNYRRADMNRALECVFAEYQKELLENQRIIAGNAQFAGIAAGRGVRFTTGLLLLGKGLGMRETPIRPHSWH